MEYTTNMHTKQFSSLVLPVITVFLLAFGYFLFLQAAPIFPDPDSFYHIAVAQLIAKHGVLETFPWLTFTPLATHFTDQHFLYHVLLIPFLSRLDPVVGAKLATVFINASLFALLTAFFIRFRVRFWYVPIIILFLTNPFLFRINLVKAPGLSILLLVIGLWFLFRRRVWPLAVLGFLYVWTYGGFTLLGIFACLYALVAIFWDWHHHNAFYRVYRASVPARWQWKMLTRHPSIASAGATLLGILAGVLINPFFPQNLYFYWQQLVQIGIINFQKVINVGGEWRPYGLVSLLANNVFVSILVLVALVFFFLYFRKQSAESWMLLFLTVFLFVITLKSRRYVELYVPFAVIFGTFALRDAFEKIHGKDLVRFGRQFLQKHMVLGMVLAIYVFATSLAVMARDSVQLNHDLKSGFSSTYLANASAWLATHTPQDSIVVHSDWDEFPILLYHNQHNLYIVGLDPTFMYQYDKTLYQRWADVTSGKRANDALRIITQDLQSETVLVASDHDAMNRTIQQLPGFVQVYKDGDATIYQLREQHLPSTGSDTQQP